MPDSPSPEGVVIIYDGECPVCSHYVNGVRLREAGGAVRLQDARDETGEVRALTAQGYDLNQGMVVKVGETIHYGADAMHLLSLMTTPVGFFNRLVFVLSRSPRSSKIFYPVFRSLRLLLLRIIGVKPIESPSTR